MNLLVSVTPRAFSHQPGDISEERLQEKQAGESKTFHTKPTPKKKKSVRCGLLSLGDQEVLLQPWLW